MLHAALTNCSGAKDSDFEKGRHFLTGVLRSNDEERLSLSECREEARHSWAEVQEPYFFGMLTIQLNLVFAGVSRVQLQRNGSALS